MPSYYAKVKALRRRQEPSAERSKWPMLLGGVTETTSSRFASRHQAIAFAVQAVEANLEASRPIGTVCICRDSRPAEINADGQVAR